MDTHDELVEIDHGRHQEITTFYFGIHDSETPPKFQTEQIFKIKASFKDASKAFRVFIGIFKDWIRCGILKEK
jgi:hypothetical protein